MVSKSEVNNYTQYRSLYGKTVLITGGASGIGAALVEAFSAQNARVAFVDIDRDASESLCARLEAQGYTRPLFAYCNISDTDALQASIAAINLQLGDISVLINNAANDQRFATRTLTAQDWHQGMAINLHPVFFAAQAVQPMMAALGGGVIINVSSVNVHFAPPELAGYIAAKAGILGLTKALATDFGADNIRVNAILPGWVATEKQLELWLTPEAEAELMQRLCLKKRLAAADVAKLALFLAADDAAMITAQEFVVDGGRI